MTWMEMDTWIVLVGITCAVACALPGCFLVLRKMSMMGDAISHAVLPGLALAFILTGSRSSLPMFIGAAIVGLLTAVFTQWVSQFGNVDRGAAMGIVFTILFAIGLMLIVKSSEKVDLDASCVLMGNIEFSAQDMITIAGRDVSRPLVILGSVMLMNLFLIVLFFKEFRIAAFDPELATTTGFHAGVMHYFLMMMVAVTTVASFEAVGSIIVIAMLVVPPCCAWMITDRLGVMLALSALFGAVSAVLGHIAAVIVPSWFGIDESASTSGMMATVVGLLFILVWICEPRRGLIRRWITQRRSKHKMVAPAVS
ncbi:metal ABC transporter permease [Kiritimatiellota bacterium B12222]|nr:metal ABC transporter permease [Kiritimatiellota bacterium B12222]